MKSIIKKISRTLSVFIIFLLVFTMFSSITESLIIEKEGKTTYENDDYIIELVDTPVFTYFNNAIKEIGGFFPSISYSLLKNKIDTYRNFILNSHKKAIDSILSLVGEKDRNNIVFSREYTGIFNGLFIKNMPLSLINKIKELPFIKNVYTNYNFSVYLDESVPLIKASDAWKIQNKFGKNITGKGINIAILDTGIDYTHPDLSSNYVDGYDFVNNDDDPMDDHGHGTHCAGIIAGTGVNSDYKYVGVAPDANLYAFKVLDSQGSGNLDNYIAGLEAAVDPNGDGDPSDHVDIISISFGTDEAGSPNDVVSLKADEIVDIGIVVVAAAGNNGPDSSSITSPGCSLKTITVGSIDKNSVISVYSSRGPVEFNGSFYIKPDIVAPGVGIKSTYPGGGYVVMSGTSMACPHIAGAAALILQAYPNIKPAEVKQILKDSSVDLGEIGNDNDYGSGRINVLNALNPPIAFLNISSRIPHSLIEIMGSAMKSSGNINDFINYSLYYSYESTWIKIFENDEEIDNNILYRWDTTNLTSGFYELKLVVKCLNQTNVIIKSLVIGDANEVFVVSFPSIVNESSIFQVKITDFNGTSAKAFVLFFSSFSLPSIKYGSNINFKAPSIYSSISESKKVKIIVIIFLRIKIITKEITILSN
ncbi:MAG: S8 family peptidase [Candidatus Thermoplasmatota archaeon]|nr:S8 family peptidase [Candidatus Thermoplasmatota archaeon]